MEPQTINFWFSLSTTKALLTLFVSSLETLTVLPLQPVAWHFTESGCGPVLIKESTMKSVVSIWYKTLVPPTYIYRGVSTKSDNGSSDFSLTFPSVSVTSLLRTSPPTVTKSRITTKTAIGCIIFVGRVKLLHRPGGGLFPRRFILSTTRLMIHCFPVFILVFIWNLKQQFYCTNVRLVKPTFCDQLKIDDLPMLASENILKLDNMTKNWRIVRKA